MEFPRFLYCFDMVVFMMCNLPIISAIVSVDFLFLIIFRFSGQYVRNRPRRMREPTHFTSVNPSMRSDPISRNLYCG